jgi:hypothetical protein
MQPPRKPLTPKRDETAAMRAATPDLNRLGRYERRARSCLRRAMLRFVSLKFLGGRPVASSDLRAQIRDFSAGDRL